MACTPNSLLLLFWVFVVASSYEKSLTNREIAELSLSYTPGDDVVLQRFLEAVQMQSSKKSSPKERGLLAKESAPVRRLGPTYDAMKSLLGYATKGVFGAGMIGLVTPLFWTSTAYDNVVGAQSVLPLYNVQLGSAMINANSRTCDTGFSWNNPSAVGMYQGTWQQCRYHSKIPQYFGGINVNSYWCANTGFGFTWGANAKYGAGLSGNCLTVCNNDVGCMTTQENYVSGFTGVGYGWGPMATSCGYQAWSDWTVCAEGSCSGYQNRSRTPVVTYTQTYAEDYCPWLTETRECRSNTTNCQATCPYYGVEYFGWGGYILPEFSQYPGLPTNGQLVPPEFNGSQIMITGIQTWQECGYQFNVTFSDSWLNPPAVNPEQWWGAQWTWYREAEVCLIFTLGAGSQSWNGAFDNTTQQYSVVSGDLSTWSNLTDSQCQQDCAYSPWSDWDMSQCTYQPCASSNAASRSRTLFSWGINGGLVCSGSMTDTIECSQMSAYFDSCPQDCQEGSWGAWSQCSTSCGVGTQSRNRPSIVPALNGGAPCVPTQTQNCNPGDCETCTYGEWSNFTECSTTCGTGTMYQTREVSGCSVTEEYNSTECNQEASTQCPVDCVIGQWSAWSGCSLACLGPGSQVRTRPIYQMPVNNSGVANCTDPDTGAPVNAFSAGAMTQYLDGCNAGVPCPIDCQVSSWSGWSACSVQCGGGTMTRTREVAVEPQYGGLTCGTCNENATCNQLLCSESGSCTGLSEWSSWNSCSEQTSGNSTVCMQNATRTGTGCSGAQLITTQPCSCGAPIGVIVGASAGALAALLLLGGGAYYYKNRRSSTEYEEDDAMEEYEEEESIEQTVSEELGGYDASTQGGEYVDVDPDSSFWNKRSEAAAE